MKTDKIFQDIRRELIAQYKTWGEQNHNPFKWHTILSEEVGEVAEAILETAASLDKGDDDRALAWANEYEKELTHVAAVAVATLDSLRRNRKEKE